MPPWPASSSYGGPFRDARVLTDTEIATLNAWAEAKCPEGDPKDCAEPRKFSSAWPLGEPDLTLTMPEPYKVAATGDDDFRVFVLKTNLPEDRWIRAVDFRPGNRSVVHHVIAAVDPSGRGRKLDAADPGPGYYALGGFGDGVPITAFLPIWTPGALPRHCPEGTGFLLPKGADVLIQVHYHKNGKPETDATAVGLYLSKTPMPRQVHTGFVFPNVSISQTMVVRQRIEAAKKAGRSAAFTELLRDVLVIPPGTPNYEVKASTKAGAGMMGRPLRRDIILTAVMPHMHWLGKDFTFTAVLPDGKTRIPLIKSTTGISTGKAPTPSKSQSGCRRDPGSRWRPTSTTPIPTHTTRASRPSSSSGARERTTRCASASTSGFPFRETPSRVARDPVDIE